MSTFKVGDIVERKDGFLHLGILKNEVTSVSDNGYSIRFNGDRWNVKASEFKLSEDTRNHHPHHDLIIAWAKGAEIESQVMTGKSWNSVVHPSWFKHCKYRIKPTEPTELEKLIKEHKAMGETIDKLTKELMNEQD